MSALQRYRFRVAARWDAHWFAPAEPGPLGVCRALFYGLVLLRVAPEVVSAPWAGVAPVFWMPTDLFAALHLSVAPGPLLTALDAIWRIALALACVGWCTRASSMVAFLVGAYLLGLPQCFGKVDHWSGLLVMTMGVLALARSGDAWSIDELRRQNLGGQRPRTSGEYRWPIEVVRLLLVLVFFAGGVAKLRQGGLGWLDPANMRAILLVPHYANDRVLPELGLVLAEMPLVCGLLALLTVTFEVGAPLALRGGRLAGLIVGGLFLMQLGIATLLGVHASVPFLACYVFWLPWRAAWVAAADRAPSTLSEAALLPAPWPPLSRNRRSP